MGVFRQVDTELLQLAVGAGTVLNQRRPSSALHSALLYPVMGIVENARCRSFGLLPIALLVCGSAIAQVRVREITIRSGWGGLGTPQDKTISIRAKNGTLVYDGKRVE